MILASELTTTQDGDASLVGPLLDRIKRRIGTVLADGAYDGEPVYRAVAAHTPDAEVIIPPRSTAVPGETAASAPTQRDQHLPMIAERGRLGWQRAVCCKVMNMMTSLGMPASRKVAGTTTFQGGARQRAECCTNVERGGSFTVVRYAPSTTRSPCRRPPSAPCGRRSG